MTAPHRDAFEQITASIAAEIAEEANKCCYRSDGYKEDIERFAKYRMAVLWNAAIEGGEVPRLDLDAIRQAIEERDAAIQAVDDLANNMIYNGNSVSWWYSKAVAYGSALDRAWEELKKAGILADGRIDVAEGIRQLAKEK